MKRYDPRSAIRDMARMLRAHAGEIAYYAAVALSLTALACAAEGYRHRRTVEAPPASLPASELAAPTEAAPEERATLLSPEGEPLRGYSNEPAWNEQLGLWESHPAVDYRLRDGAARCLAAGTVRAVEAGYVVVDSGDFALRYASVEPRDGLAVGEALAAGEIIGEAVNNLPGEAALGPHLHLEMLVNGAPADFAAWIGATPAGD